MSQSLDTSTQVHFTNSDTAGINHVYVEQQEGLYNKQVYTEAHLTFLFINPQPVAADGSAPPYCGKSGDA